MVVLRQDGTDASVARVGLDGERALEIWQCQNWCAHHRLLQHPESSLRLIIPEKSFLGEEARQGLGDDAIVWHEFMVVAREAEERPDLSRPDL